ncbi:hypothetical protein RM530_18130 [Algiphilus sp. W345]|uniref:Uncharacterized protein n=1 Tax=Banduia mediterranea TaxID=3075609 RepID=A0ABU2WN11_9GAMM|nr:hypothetical protein [Algiphilus sp. W345]MDT0499263.1 hypothetical protein [Algiphilus sp. W345]
MARHRIDRREPPIAPARHADHTVTFHGHRIDHLATQPNNPRWDSRSHLFPVLESFVNLRFTRTCVGRLSLFYLIQLHKSLFFTEIAGEKISLVREFRKRLVSINMITR